MTAVVYLILLLGVAAGQDIKPDIDEFVQTVLGCSGVPGLTLAVVRNGQEYYQQGYGVKDLASGDPVNENTRFLLASVSKHISGVAMATVLADEDRDEVWWDTPVRTVLGADFYFNDVTRTEQANLRDMFAHRMGTPRHDDLRLAGYTLEEFVSKLRFLGYDYDFRDRYRYQNIMYSVAELTLETLSGNTWQQTLQQNLFTPLGMSRSTIITDETVWDSMATGYYVDDDGQLREVSKEVPKTYYGSFGMSGGVVSTAADMSKWILFQLAEGETPDGTEILSDAGFRDTHVPLIQRTSSPDWYRPQHPVTYAPPHKYSTGWQETTYRDYELFTHTGSQGGYRTHLVIVPSLQHGVFIGVNKSPDGNVRDTVAMYVLDLLMGEGPWLSKDTVCDYIESFMAKDTSCEHCSLDLPTFIAHTKAKHGAPQSEGDAYRNEELVGKYGDYAYGNVTISIDDNTQGLIMEYGVEKFTWDLTETEPLVFTAKGREPFWFHEVALVFEMEGAQASAVTVSFEEDAPPRFVRGLDFNNPPAPPELCEDPLTLSRHTTGTQQT